VKTEQPAEAEAGSGDGGDGDEEEVHRGGDDVMKKDKTVRITHKLIEDALKHYRCPQCRGRGNFYMKEASFTAWKYNLKKKSLNFITCWEFRNCEPIEEFGYTTEDYFDTAEDFLKRVFCGDCMTVLTMSDGTPVEPDRMDDWLKELARRWYDQQVERQKLVAELAVAKETLNPVGTIADLEAKIKALETISEEARRSS
jgi:hypothetical protein